MRDKERKRLYNKQYQITHRQSIRTQRQAYYKSNRESWLKKQSKYYQKHRIEILDTYRNNPSLAFIVNSLFNNARYSHAKKRGMEFNITREFIRNLLQTQATCPVFGTPFEYASKSHRNPRKPSLDRLDPNKGYTIDNVRLISWRANDLKRNATSSELRAIADWMDSENKKKDGC